MNASDCGDLSEIVFEATTDAMALVEATGSGWRIRSTNDEFEAAFGDEGVSLEGRNLETVVGQDVRARVRADDGGEAQELTARLGRADRETVVRVRQFETDEVPPGVLVVVPDPPEPASRAGWRAHPEAVLRPVLSMAQAETVPEACDGAAALLREAFGFTTFVADLDDDGPFLRNADAPISLSGAGRDGHSFVGRDVVDPANETRWDIVVQHPLGERGIVQVAANDEPTSLLGTSLSVELCCRYLEANLDRIDRTAELQQARDRHALFNRVLRHEVLNGLNLVQARLDLIEDSIAEEDGEHYETVDYRVEDLLDRVRAIRRIQHDDEVAPGETRGLPPLLRERVERASERHPDARFTIDGTIPEIDVRADHLAGFCLRNVLHNSVQHAGIESPAVHVSATREDDVAAIDIADNGPGIPDDLDRSVFGEGVSSQEGDSHGQGLFLVRQIVEEVYGGHVEVDESEYGGATFRIELPLASD